MPIVWGFTRAMINNDTSEESIHMHILKTETVKVVKRWGFDLDMFYLKA